MTLVYGTAILALAALLFGITLIGSRNPKEPFWSSDCLVADIYAPAIVALVAMATGFFVKFIISINSQLFGVKEFLLELGIVAVSLMISKRMRIKQHLVDYETVQKTAEIILPNAFSQTIKYSGPSEPPDAKTSGKIAA